MAKKQTKTDLSAVLASLQSKPAPVEAAVEKVLEQANTMIAEGGAMVKEAKKKKVVPKSEPVVQKTEPKKPATLKELGIKTKPEDLAGVVALAQSLEARLKKGEFEGNHSLTWGAKLWIGNLVRRATKMAEAASEEKAS